MGKTSAELRREMKLTPGQIVFGRKFPRRVSSSDQPAESPSRPGCRNRFRQASWSARAHHRRMDEDSSRRGRQQMSWVVDTSVLPTFIRPTQHLATLRRSASRSIAQGLGHFTGHISGASSGLEVMRLSRSSSLPKSGSNGQCCERFRTRKQATSCGSLIFRRSMMPSLQNAGLLTS